MQRRRLTPVEVKAYRELARAARKLRAAQEEAERHCHQRDDNQDDRDGQLGAGHD